MARPRGWPPRSPGPVTDRELRIAATLPEASCLAVEKKFLPGGGRFTVAIVDRDQLLLAVGRGAHQDKNALALVVWIFQTHVEVDPIRPDIHVVPVC